MIDEYELGWADGREDLAEAVLRYVDADPLHQLPDNLRAFLESELGFQLDED